MNTLERIINNNGKGITNVGLDDPTEYMTTYIDPANGETMVVDLGKLYRFQSNSSTFHFYFCKKRPERRVHYQGSISRFGSHEQHLPEEEEELFLKPRPPTEARNATRGKRPTTQGHRITNITFKKREEEEKLQKEIQMRATVANQHKRDRYLNDSILQMMTFNDAKYERDENGNYYWRLGNGRLKCLQNPDSEIDTSVYTVLPSEVLVKPRQIAAAGNVKNKKRTTKKQKQINKRNKKRKPKQKVTLHK